MTKEECNQYAGTVIKIGKEWCLLYSEYDSVIETYILKNLRLVDFETGALKDEDLVQEFNNRKKYYEREEVINLKQLNSVLNSVLDKLKLEAL